MNIAFSKPDIGEEEIAAVGETTRSGWLAAGNQTESFEQEFSNYISPEGDHYYCIFTNSCTSALKMAYKWAAENVGFKFNVPRNTFCATYAAISETPRCCWEYQDFAPEYGSRVNVHYGGVKDETSCLIEDSAHRIEPNDPLIGKIRCYSFYATKNMTTGSGGMLVTNDKAIYEQCRLYWRDGLSTSTSDRLRGVVGYTVETFAGGYDGNDIAAALGRVQLRRLPEFTRKRNERRDRYNAAFSLDWSGNHLYPYPTGSVEAVYDLTSFLKERGIQAGYHYPETGWTSVSLPLYPSLTEEEQEAVVAAVKAWESSRESH